MDLKHYKDLLLAKKAEIESLNEVSSASRDTVELDQTSVGRLSRMDALQGQAMNKAIAQRRHNDIMRIKSALLRLIEDEYGYCLLCGEDIDEKRLSFDPAALHCTACAKKH